MNNDGELAIDISESDEMEELLQKEIDRQGVNCDKSRHTGNYQATRIFSSNLAPMITKSPPDLELSSSMRDQVEKLSLHFNNELKPLG